MPGRSFAPAEGEDYRDFCTQPDCPVCTIWQHADETDDAWRARIGALYRSIRIQHRKGFKRAKRRKKHAQAE